MKDQESASPIIEPTTQFSDSKQSMDSGAITEPQVDDQVPAVRLPSPQRRAAKNLRATIAIAAGIAVLAYFGVVPRLRQSQTLSAEVAAVKSEAPAVQVVQLSPARTVAELVLPSNVQAINSTTINAQTTGYLKARYVDIGSVVTKGQLLAEVESPEMDQQVSQSLAEIARSRAGVSQAEADVSKGEAGVAASSAVVIQDRAAESEAIAQLAGLKAQQSRVESTIRVAEAHRQEAVTRLEAARAELSRTESGLRIADKTLQRWKDLFKAEAVPGQEVDEKQADYDSAIAKVAESKAGISTAQAALAAATESVESTRSELESAKANVESGRQRVALAAATVKSAMAAVQASNATVRASSSGVSSAKAVVIANQANAMRYQALQGFERIVAPFSGVITARNVDQGDLVGAPNTGASGGSTDQAATVTKTGLFGLARTDELRIQLDVPQSFAGYVKQNQPADILVPELPGRVFRGYIFRVSGALDSSSRTLLAEIRLKNADGALRPGTFAKVRLTGIGAQAIRIPADTLLFDSEGTRVAVVTPDSAVHFQSIVVGRDLGSQVEVLQGLEGTERLISNPSSLLTEGEKVKPVGGVN